MTNQEAIERIRDHMRIHPMDQSSEIYNVAEALNIAIEALKAQEPVKPVAKQEADEVTSDILNAAYCGKCGVRIGRQKVNFCSNCGREVNWDGWIAEPHRK